MFNMLFTRKETVHDVVLLRPLPTWMTLVCRAGIGLLSGMVGIGGGVFLAPLIILAYWGTTKLAAATVAGFIVVNSISGLVGRALGGNFVLGTFGVLLLPAGIFGALAGSSLGVRFFFRPVDTAVIRCGIVDCNNQFCSWFYKIAIKYLYQSFFQLA
jgi:uncharacterized membrane protein YfcA